MSKQNTKISNLPHKIPSDLKKVLSKKAKALTIWEQEITPLAKNEWICWIISAKKTETRDSRLKRTIEGLLEGKRRPCCWAGCIHR